MPMRRPVKEPGPAATANTSIDASSSARLGDDVEQRGRQPLGVRARRVADALGAHAIVLDDRRAQRARRRVQSQYTHAINYRICQRRRRRRCGSISTRSSSIAMRSCSSGWATSTRCSTKTPCVAARALELTLTSRSKDANGGGIPMCGVPFHAVDGYIARLVKKGISRRDLRSGRGSAQGQGHRQARSRPRRLARHADRRQLPRRARAGVPDGGRAAAPRQRRTRRRRRAARRLDRRVHHRRVSRRRRPAGARRRARGAQAARDRRPPPAPDPMPGASPPAGVADRRRSTAGHSTPSRRGARCSISCASPASKGSASIGGRPPSPPPARWSTTCKTTQKVDLAHVRSLDLPPARRRAAHRSDDAQAPRDPGRLGRRTRRIAARRARPDDHLDRQPDAARVAAAAAAVARSDPRSARRRRGARVPDDRSRQVPRRDQDRPGPRAAGRARRARARPGRATSSRLKHSIAAIPRVRTRAVRVPGAARLLPARRARRAARRARSGSSRSLVDDPPALAREGGFIRDGLDAELDELRTISRSGKQIIAQMEEAERARTGIASLKVRYNRVFGYYIEISKSNLHAVPARLPPQADDCRRRALHHAGAQGIRGDGARRRRADRRARARAVRRAARAPSPPRRRGSRRRRGRSPRSTSLAALAETAAVNNYTKPHVHDGDEMAVFDARHPVVERRTAAAGEAFVPNDILLNATDVAARDPDRAEHGRQVDLPAADRARLRSWRRPARSSRRARRRSRSSTASSRASARRTTSRAATRPSWWRCRRPPTSSTPRRRAAWSCSTRSAAAPPPSTA